MIGSTMPGAIDTAILLAAGEGSRLRSHQISKPLCPVGGTSLLAHAIHRLHRAGLSRVLVVTGYRGDLVERHVASASWPIEIRIVANTDWHLPNGISALAAAEALAGAPALLAMGDHLVEPEIYRRLRDAGAGPGLRLGTDRRLDSDLVDPLDVTRVLTEGNRIAALGKEMERYDAYDVGIFAVGPAFFDALSGLAAPSITDGVRALIPGDKAEIVDCTGLRWIDVDDPPALAKAEAIDAASW
ncbi:phosphocholine cytidylyltransferase family protein [Sphingosinicella rhizophila]|uniref:NTP transferase domain-containing protein n=1 Tax=Sphingosinicella rhizophila TaxID=3050082 RepID=A0ABU3Q6H4_9SPHN|nr:NTP transferase domain-containing protein [Sphingosinicella sp. GR2756]MDT9598995.1 NTP transferase domain-containing protein [Sphingosinicella sp. GR2756]